MVSTDLRFKWRFRENYFYETLFFIVLNEKAKYNVYEFQYITSSNRCECNNRFSYGYNILVS